MLSILTSWAYNNSYKYPPPTQNRELNSSDLRVRQQALLLLCDVLHLRENLATALGEGIASSLQALLSDGDGVVRERSAQALTIIARA